jgi:hypothetical protein
VTFDDFVNASSPHALEKEFPHNIALVDPQTVDLQLKEGSAPVDAGKLIPGINEDFTGDAPDLGALERGQPAPVYGPRGELPEPWRMTEAALAEGQQLPGDPGEPVIRVACGSPWLYEDPAGNLWLGDQPYAWPRPWGYVGNPNSWFDQGTKGLETPLTQLYRFERTELDSYVFTLEPGRYKVRLHFVERWGQGRVFDVVVNNDPKLRALDIYQEAGGDHQPITREVEAVVEGEKLVIQFLPHGENAPLINGIEIFRVEE